MRYQISNIFGVKYYYTILCPSLKFVFFLSQWRTIKRNLLLLRFMACLQTSTILLSSMFIIGLFQPKFKLF